MKQKTTAILLAGGQGTRFQTTTPKQYLQLNGKPIVRYSFDLFLTEPSIEEVVVVCEPQYQCFFENSSLAPRITFALPGLRRQDSVWNGLQAITTNPDFVCVHDAARPLITADALKHSLEAAVQHGAAAIGMPLKFTLKEHDGKEFVKYTPDRSLFWEIQTPQVMRTSWLKKGFEHAQLHNITVTDDVSLLELLNYPVKLVQGSYSNLKITTPLDLILAENLIKNEASRHA
jgi:2-C-methyl-D-erythritol 4-phosphate cytidylyltransferase